MPGVPEGLIHSSQLVDLPLQSLEASEVGGFLDVTFRDVARRPGSLLLRETASVVRRLSLLAQRGVPSAAAMQGGEALQEYYQSPQREEDLRVRLAAGRVAKVLWGGLLQWGRMQPCTNDQALRFLRRHSTTYLAGNPDLSPAMQVIRDFEVPPLPPNVSKPFQPPHSMSERMTAHGEGNPRLRDDVSERIYAALHALRRADVNEPLRRIADALDKWQIPRRRRDSVWTYETVAERVKAYEERQRKNLRKAPGSAPLDERLRTWRDQLVNRWIAGYRSTLSEPKRYTTTTRHVGWFCFDCNNVMPAVQDAAPPTCCASCSSQQVAVLMATLTVVAPAGRRKGRAT